MITEDYCSFEVSKLLKEKGFNEEVISYYDTEGQGYFISPRGCNIGTGSVYAAPTHQMAMKWLREVHKLFIEISVSIDLNSNHHYHYTILDKECKYIIKGYDWSYEEAVETALKYVLENLI